MIMSRIDKIEFKILAFLRLWIAKRMSDIVMETDTE